MHFMFGTKWLVVDSKTALSKTKTEEPKHPFSGRSSRAPGRSCLRLECVQPAGRLVQEDQAAGSATGHGVCWVNCGLTNVREHDRLLIRNEVLWQDLTTFVRSCLV